MIVSKFKQPLWAIFLIVAFAFPAAAKTVSRQAEDGVTVASAIAAIKTAVEDAGAQVFAVVNFQKGAQSVGETIRPTTLIIFGSPKIGGTIFREGQSFGLYLPLKILAHEDADGQVWLSFDDPLHAARIHGFADDHPAVENMHNVLTRLTGLASDG